MAVGTVDADFQLGSFEPQLLGTTDLAKQRLLVIAEGASVWQQRRIGRNVAALGAAEQLINRYAEGLAADVPQRHVNGAQRADQRPPAPGHLRARVQLGPN